MAKQPRPPSGLMASFPGQYTAGPPLPNPPLGLAVNAVTTTSVTLGWSPPYQGAGVTYNLYQGGVAVRTGLASASTTVTGLQPATAYTYAVTAVNANGEGLPSNAVQATTSAVSASTVTNFLMISQEANAATFTCTPVSGATQYKLYRATISAQGVVGTYAVVATSATLPIRDGNAPTITTPGAAPYPYIPATGYRYALSAVTPSGETALNYNLQMWIYSSGGKSGGIVGPNGPAFWSENLNFSGGTSNPNNTTNLQSGSTSNWRLNGAGFQPRSSEPFLVDPNRTLDFAETSMFDGMTIDVYWPNTGDTLVINPVSRVAGPPNGPGDNFNSAQVLLGDPSTTDLGPVSVGGQWMTYKIPSLGAQGHALQLGYGSCTASVSGTTLTVTAVASPGLNMEGSNYLTGPGLTVGQLNGPANTPWISTTPNGAPGGPGTYTLGTNQGTIASETIAMQRTNYYKGGPNPGNWQSNFILIDNWGLYANAPGHQIKWNPGPYGAQGIQTLGGGDTIGSGDVNNVLSEMANISPYPGIVGYRLLTTWGFWVQSSATDTANAFAVIDKILTNLANMTPPRHLYITFQPNIDTSGSLTTPASSFYIPAYILNNPATYGQALGISDPGHGGYYIQASGGFGANVCNANVLAQLIATMQSIAARYDNPTQGTVVNGVTLNSLFEGIQIIEDSNWFPASNTGLGVAQFLPGVQNFLLGCVAAFPHTNIAMQATFMGDSAHSYAFEPWLVQHRVAPGTADSFGKTYFQNNPAGGNGLQWGSQALCGFPVSGVPDQRPLCRPQMDVQSIELSTSGKFKPAGAPFTAQDIANAMGSQTLGYGASHYFFTMMFSTNFQGLTIPSANVWSNAAPVLQATPTITSYPPNYP